MLELRPSKALYPVRPSCDEVYCTQLTQLSSGVPDFVDGRVR